MVWSYYISKLKFCKIWIVSKISAVEVTCIRRPWSCSCFCSCLQFTELLIVLETEGCSQHASTYLFQLVESFLQLIASQPPRDCSSSCFPLFLLVLSHENPLSGRCRWLRQSPVLLPFAPPSYWFCVTNVWQQISSWMGWSRKTNSTHYGGKKFLPWDLELVVDQTSRSADAASTIKAYKSCMK